MSETLQEQMREALRLTRAGRVHEATAAIQQALGNPAVGDAARTHGRAGAEAMPITLELPAPRSELPLLDADKIDDRPASEPEARTPVERPGSGSFTAGSHTEAGQTRRYKLYAPPGAAGRSLPLVVMLHGCTQDPDDFAAGTAMNECAAELGFFVLYPEQSQAANPSRCWNWFQRAHQQRGGGEPASLVAMVRAVIAQHGVDGSRVYVAGLSAGGAMAAIVAAEYPEVFAAVGVHSGLPVGEAEDLVQALALMKGGINGSLAALRPLRAGVAARRPRPVPTIVFHGDQDRIVHPRNGDAVIQASVGAGTRGAASVDYGSSPLGRQFTRSVYVDAQGQTVAEHWLVHGAGHAWSGGDAKGSHTDASGPDATREMVRFFLRHGQGTRPRATSD